MTIFRRRPNENFWCYKVRLGPNQWRTFKGFSDKRATDEKARQHQAQIDRGEVGLVDPYAEHKGSPLAQHVADYLAELIAKGNDPENTHRTELRLKKMHNVCGWNRLPDITTTSFLKFRDTGNMAKAAPKTRNDYQQIIRQFCRWCVRNGRLPLDPFQNLATVKVNGDIRRQRRALTDQEVQCLLQVTPAPRRTVYLAALLTGLRRAELEQLRWSDVHLDSPKPYLDVRASTTKNGQRAIIWLRDDLATTLRSLDQSGDAVFTVPDMDVFKADLASAEIAEKDKQGRIVDFHCLRHTLATNLGRAGVSVQTAMQVMRHSDIRLTTRTYTDASLLPTAEAIETLPRWEVQFQEKAVRTVGIPDVEIISRATKGATKTCAFPCVSVPSDAQQMGLTDNEHTRMDSEKSRNLQGVGAGNEDIRGVGIEPTTKGL